MKHGLLQGLTAPIAMGMSQCLIFINLNLSCIQWYKFCVCRGKGSRDTVRRIKIMKNGLFHEFTAPYLMGMSHVASDSSSLMSIGGRVQEIRLDKDTMHTKSTETDL